MGATKKKNTRKNKKLTWPHSLQGKRGGEERKLINDIQLTTTSNCEKAEGQVEKEDQ